MCVTWIIAVQSIYVHDGQPEKLYGSSKEGVYHTFYDHNNPTHPDLLPSLDQWPALVCFLKQHIIRGCIKYVLPQSQTLDKR